MPRFRVSYRDVIEVEASNKEEAWKIVQDDIYSTAELEKVEELDDDEN